MNSNHLEQLIGKLLDSEITPAEKQLLDAAIEKHPELLNHIDKMGQLSDATQQTLRQEVIEKGKSFDEIFSRALTVKRPQSRHRRLRLHPAIHVMATLAAGFLLGLITYGLFDAWKTKIQASNINPPQVIVEKPAETITDEQSAPIPSPKFLPAPGPFYYTDSQGNIRPIYPILPTPENNVENAEYTGE
ncbi:MAG: hypothetical protein JW709_08100 [Sedimentisphaerales bacterium]|nr:hypothetical protein [Sedimentisphaerales bacterium]